MSLRHRTSTILLDEPLGPVGIWGDRDQAVGFENTRTYVERAQESQAELDARIFPGLGCPANPHLGGREDACAKTRAHTRVHFNRRLGPGGLRC